MEPVVVLGKDAAGECRCCILLGRDAGKNLRDANYEFRVSIGDNNIIGTQMTEIEYAIIHSVIKRCVEKGYN